MAFIIDIVCAIDGDIRKSDIFDVQVCLVFAIVGREELVQVCG